ncbi:MAG: SpoIID/LytB domain-containing protein [Ruminococcus sp.]|nr:SpoIID/LytB domain-containing protein [Ruminococcus sp.]
MKDIIKISIVFTVFAALIPAIVFLSGKTNAAQSVKADLKPSEEVYIKVLDEQTKKITEYEQTSFIVLSLMAQIPSGYEDEAIKAQAVLIRTYLARRSFTEDSSPTKELKGALLSNDRSKYQTFFTEKQAKKYFGSDYTAVYEKLYTLTLQTEGELLTYKGEPVLPAYHAVSCGVTRSAKDAWGEDIPYLVSVKSEADANSHDYETKLTLHIDEMKQKLIKAFPNIAFDDSKAFLELENDKNGIITKAKVCGEDVGSGELCRALDLSSPCVTVKFSEGKAVFTVKGLGHLVGLSLYGANEMAKNGSSHREILEYYFSGAKVQ